MRIAIVSDAWEPQVNGVVNTIKNTRHSLLELGHDVLLVTPDNCRTFACPTYPEIRLAYQPYAKVAASLDGFVPDCIHIATEGPMGLAARRYCLNRGLHFTSAYHTRFPEYLRSRSRIPLALSYCWLRWFHGPSKAVMVATPRMQDALQQRGFTNLSLWGRGVDTTHFAPREREQSCIERPLHLYVGRLAVEKNVDAFLQLDVPGSKWVIGDGPLREALEQRYPAVHFLGAKPNNELAPYYSCADVFVFPSRTDTFGLVLIEAMACGVPVAAYPVEGPIDVVAQGRSGMLDDDLGRACQQALALDRVEVRQCALAYSWEAATRQFLHHLHPVRHAGAPQEHGLPEVVGI
ncbi:glycosyltransferase family 4 protein [Undibacterium arcticum]|uniref:Glycosyltransferase family 4 protein n=1 Tax=Undibacterium arcticum TaxID=1762892 RepID=A0ABV7F5W0_9BURK